MSWRFPLLMICAVFAILCLLYSRETPYRSPGLILLNRSTPVQDVGAPDERQHANYILWVAGGNGLPVFDPKDPNLYEHYQAHQPPLYYYLAAPVSKIDSLASPEAGKWVRGLSTVFGLLTVVGVFFAARWGLGSDSVALAAATITALLPMFVALHSAISNDPLLIAECTWTLALCALGIRNGWTWRLALLTGILVGAALWTKTSALALLPVVIVALIASHRVQKLPRIAWFALIIPLLVALPWWLRNQNLYGDPFAISAFRDAFTGTAQAQTFVEAFGAFGYWSNWVAWWTLRSFVGAFGYMDIFLPDKLYRVIFAVFALIALAWVWRKTGPTAPRDSRSTAFSLCCWTLVVVIVLMFIQFNMTYFQAQARYLYPAIAPITIGLGVGACAALGRFERAAWWVFGTALIVLNVYVLTILPAEFRKRTTAIATLQHKFVVIRVAVQPIPDLAALGNVGAVNRVDWNTWCPP